MEAASSRTLAYCYFAGSSVPLSFPLPRRRRASSWTYRGGVWPPVIGGVPLPLLWLPDTLRSLALPDAGIFAFCSVAIFRGSLFIGCAGSGSTACAWLTMP